MANVTITIPDAVAPRVMAALAARGAPGVLPTDTPGQAGKKVILDFIKTVTKHYEAEQVADTARQSALATAEADLTLT